MKLFKSLENKVFGFEADGSQDHLIESDMIEITQEQAEVILNPPPTFDQIKARFIQAVQMELNVDAQLKGYDNINSACAKASIPGRFQAECIAYGERWRDAWAHCYAELEKVQNGDRPMPTIEQVLSELPSRVSA